jgi:hypothetical protein
MARRCALQIVTLERKGNVGAVGKRLVPFEKRAGRAIVLHVEENFSAPVLAAVAAGSL